MQEAHVHPLGQEDPLEKGVATYSSIFSWRIPWTEELGEVTKSQTQLSNQHTLSCHFIAMLLFPARMKIAVHWLWLWQKDISWKTAFWWLGAGGEGDNRGWDGWIASLTQWAWVWVNSGSWWWTGRPGVLRFMGSQRVRHDWATEVTDWLNPNYRSRTPKGRENYIPVWIYWFSDLPGKTDWCNQIEPSNAFRWNWEKSHLPQRRERKGYWTVKGKRSRRQIYIQCASLWSTI